MEKVTVRIYGHQYTVVGSKTKEHMMNVAEYVNGKMTDIGTLFPSASVSDAAILAAVNVADDYFETRADNHALQREIAQLRKDAAHFEQLWEDTKRSFAGHKEELAQLRQSRDELREKLRKSQQEADALREDDRYRELENSYFELQRENLRLKSRNSSET